MKSKFLNLVKFIPIIFLLLFTLTGCENKNVSDEPKNENTASDYTTISNDSENAPNFILTDTEGNQVKLSDYKGKIVLLDFWATWCPPCRRGIPDLIELQNEYKKNLVVIGISVDTDSKSDVVPFIKEYGINYKVVYGDYDVVEKYGNIQSVPTTFIIDQKGKIISSYIGLQRKETFKDQIDALVAKS